MLEILNWNILGRIQILVFAEELVPSLKHEIPANLVAWQLAPLLLSRMVLLDKAAVEHFLPHMLTPKGQTQLKHNHGVKVFLNMHFIYKYFSSIFHHKMNMNLQKLGGIHEFCNNKST